MSAINIKVRGANNNFREYFGDGIPDSVNTLPANSEYFDLNTLPASLPKSYINIGTQSAPNWQLYYNPAFNVATNGDMLKSVYDTNNNGVVDNSEKLNGQLASYYLSRSNHTGIQAATTVSYSNTVSGLAATNVQSAIDELKTLVSAAEELQAWSEDGSANLVPDTTARTLGSSTNRIGGIYLNSFIDVGNNIFTLKSSESLARYKFGTGVGNEGISAIAADDTFTSLGKWKFQGTSFAFGEDITDATVYGTIKKGANGGVEMSSVAGVKWVVHQDAPDGWDFYNGTNKTLSIAGVAGGPPNAASFTSGNGKYKWKDAAGTSNVLTYGEGEDAVLANGIKLGSTVAASAGTASYDSGIDKFVFNTVAGVVNLSISSVTGPSLATDRAIAIYSGTAGNTIQNSLVKIQTDGALNVPVFTSPRVGAVNGDLWCEIAAGKRLLFFRETGTNYSVELSA